MPSDQVLTSQEIGTLGFFLSLISLLGSFFYVQLSNWLRDLIAAEALFEGNKVGGDETEKTVLRQLKYSIRGQYNLVPLLTSLAVSAFILLISGVIFSILRRALPTDYLAQNLLLALGGFLTIYVVLTGYLLGRGYAIGRKVYDGTQQKPANPPDAAAS
ncbi:hypothetical protein [Brevundimonas lutea]|uniref:hypothetical protein n=1 Tax=Brevundimonas lutea TaxID=2293980 RepID=UPI000F0167F1|nr:hypothetical protein [Brevundimonas lutea]